MGIKDITLSSNSSSGTIPTPPPLEEILQSGTASSLNQNPMSGSILKILAENGFKQKIEEGYIKGHTYTILHSAPSKDFTLIDTWTETAIDTEGNTLNVPRKKYQIFTITEAPKSPEASAVPTSAGAPSSETIVNTDTPPETSPADTVLPSENQSLAAPDTGELLSSIPTNNPNPALDATARAKSIAEKIKRGGAGMTPEDWQFRNENWPLIEAQLAPKAASAPTQSPASVDAPTTAPESKRLSITSEPSVEPPVQPEAPAIVETVAEPTPQSNIPPAPISAGEEGSKLTPQHYDSRAWLMKKLKRSNPEPAAIPATSLNDSPKTPKTSSYELLKNKFSQNQPVATPSTPEPGVSVTQPDTASRKKLLIETVFGTEIGLWDTVKNIPARAFIYPSEYAWGTDEQGRIIEKTLEDYPLPARKFRERIAQATEDVATQGVPIETTPVAQIVDIIFDKGIL